jgi:CheY-like chemotaxis protein
MDTFIRFIEALAKLIGALAWPAVALVILWWFGGAIRQFLANVSEGSFKAFGVEGSAKRTIVEQAIVRADQSKKETETTVEIKVPAGSGKSRFAAAYAADLLRAHKLFDLKPKRLLWVDDHPTNNVFEMKALEELGFSIDMAVNTEDALSDMAKKQYDVIISDYSRPGDPEAAKTLVREMRKSGNDTPLIVYSSDDSDSFESKMKDAGAFAATYLASELVIRVAEAVGHEGISSSLHPATQRLRHLRSSS